MVTRIDLLAGLADADADAIRALGHTIRLAPGQPLFALGDDATHLFLIERGRVALTLPLRVGDREQPVPVEERSAGQAIGWSALIPPHHFTLAATALAGTTVLALPRTELLAYLESHPHVGYRFALNVASMVGHRLNVTQTMWLREMQRVVTLSYA